jgi:four helix bundle protein
MAFYNHVGKSGVFMKDFRKLLVWQKSHQLAVDIYKITTSFPKNETYGLTGQIGRAGGSIPANIAEGCGRGSDSDLARFLQIAMGSASELEYHLLLARDIGYLDEDKYNQSTNEVIEVKRMLAAFIKKLRAGS